MLWKIYLVIVAMLAIIYVSKGYVSNTNSKV